MFWGHTGEGISSRQAEFCHRAYRLGTLTENNQNKGAFNRCQRSSKGPKRYQRPASGDANIPGSSVAVSRETNGKPTASPYQDKRESTQFVEERFGRNLDLSFASKAKELIRRRIAGSLTIESDPLGNWEKASESGQSRRSPSFSDSDVYLFPTGMSSIFSAHRTLLASRGPLKTLRFPYVDTLKILQKWGPGCLFYGNASSEELDDLEHRLRSGEKFLGLFCEFPGNPLLKSPDLVRINQLAKTFGFPVVVDETVGNFVNVDVLPYADMVVSSLTKVFSGEANVMGGSLVVNPKGAHYRLFKDTVESEYEDTYWPEDAVFMERNSRDFYKRNRKIYTNAESVCKVLQEHPRGREIKILDPRGTPDSLSAVKDVYYPKYSSTKWCYDQCRRVTGGYGGLLSVTFSSAAEAAVFLDQIEACKGPSLGTNFTLVSPYTLLAHYRELDWSSQFGVDPNLVRISVGLEETSDLVARFQRALEVVSKSRIGPE
ncbi:MAG: hypothetical protein M1825_005075 [Sarcosagium campestre]|nr:MAG: hypothetical protein M1825_005075 [Sarcosagium campestre]